DPQAEPPPTPRLTQPRSRAYRGRAAAPRETAVPASAPPAATSPNGPGAGRPLRRARTAAPFPPAAVERAVCVAPRARGAALSPDVGPRRAPAERPQHWHTQ